VARACGCLAFGALPSGSNNTQGMCQRSFPGCCGLHSPRQPTWPPHMPANPAPCASHSSPLLAGGRRGGPRHFRFVSNPLSNDKRQRAVLPLKHFRASILSPASQPGSRQESHVDGASWSFCSLFFCFCTRVVVMENCRPYTTNLADDTRKSNNYL